eukprot:15452406-Alexandrium_andersonii.AAC.1
MRFASPKCQMVLPRAWNPQAVGDIPAQLVQAWCKFGSIWALSQFGLSSRSFSFVECRRAPA